MPDDDNERIRIQNEYVTMAQAAIDLGVSAARVRQAVLDGDLPHVVMFSRKLITRAALDEYIARTRGTTGEKPRGRPPRQ